MDTRKLYNDTLRAVRKGCDPDWVAGVEGFLMCLREARLTPFDDGIYDRLCSLSQSSSLVKRYMESLPGYAANPAPAQRMMGMHNLQLRPFWGILHKRQIA